MSDTTYNLIIIIVCLVVVAGVGVYVTYVQQAGELKRVEKSMRVAEMKQAEIASLLSEYAGTKARAEAVMKKWNSRYKIVPDSLTSPEVVGYLNDLTQRGFENFDLTVSGVQQKDGYSQYVLHAQGRGYFSSLYRFVWQIENSRRFYGVDNLALDHLDLITTNEETGRERLQVMVSFNMDIEAYFGGPEGVSATDDGWQSAAASELWQHAPDGLAPVPVDVLADRQPNVNPFFPVIMEEIPPNTLGLIDVEKATFVSIIGGEAIFKDAQGYRRVGVGDAVYLGQITSVSAVEGRVTARLNRGGIIDEVTRRLEAVPRYEQAAGPGRVTPAAHPAGGVQ